jgi:2-isopropylmalate synthase
MQSNKIEIYDTTLRDGTQGEGVNLSLRDKLDITRLLDAMGIDFLEGGWPGSNPKDIEFFKQVRDIDLQHVKVVAFGSTHRGDVTPGDDRFLQELIAADADVICIFGKTWDLHVEQALRVTHDRNLEMIAGSIEYLAAQTGNPVFYDAEHFFDGFRSDPEYALESLRVADAAGAERVILCDTNGGIMPSELAKAIRKVKTEIPHIKLGIHVHNDGGLAVANTLRAVEEGVIQIHGTVNGIGERCGNVDLTSIIANLELKMGYRCLPEGQLKHLTSLSRKVWEYLGQEGPGGQPFVGRSAFAHKGGVHVSAMQRNTTTYEHVDPDTVGNSRKILISELAGGSNLKAKLSNRYPEIAQAAAVTLILTEIQEKEHVGYSFENADGSFDLVVRRHIGKYHKCFEPLYYRIYSPSNEEHADFDGLIEASVKVRVDEHVELCAAEGNGPVDALNRALRKGLLPKFPVLAELHLTDYSVKVINSTQETAAKVRVSLEHSFQGESYGTIGVNVDIIKASWTALVEAYEYALLKHEEFISELPPRDT